MFGADGAGYGEGECGRDGGGTSPPPRYELPDGVRGGAVGLVRQRRLWQFDFFLAGGDGFAQGGQIQLRFARFREHFLFFFLDVMFDLLGQHFDFGVV